MEVNNNILDTMKLWSTSSDGMPPVRLPSSKDLARDSATIHKSKAVKKFPETARRMPTAYGTALNMGDHATTHWRRQTYTGETAVKGDHRNYVHVVCSPMDSAWAIIRFEFDLVCQPASHWHVLHIHTYTFPSSLCHSLKRLYSRSACIARTLKLRTQQLIDI